MRERRLYSIAVLFPCHGSNDSIHSLVADHFSTNRGDVDGHRFLLSFINGRVEFDGVYGNRERGASVSSERVVYLLFSRFEYHLCTR